MSEKTGQNNNDANNNPHEELKQALQHEVEHLEAKLQHLKSKVKDNTHAQYENVADYIRQKPLKSVGYAALAGIVIGYCLKK